MEKWPVIAVDFDGTCVTHEYPHVGMDIGAEPVLRELAGMGYRLVLYTMRSGSLLKDAKNWFAERKIPLYAINENPEQKSWTSSPKVYADFYIDANHIKPIHYNTLKYVFEKNGYLDITRSENEYSVHPYAAMMDKYVVDKALSEDEKRFYGQLKHMMFAARDFTIIARK